MTCKIYLREGDRNMATTFYIDVIEKALKKVYGNVSFVSDVKKITKEDVVCIITLYAYRDVLIHNFSQRIIYWWQGVTPEELRFNVSKFTMRLRLKILYNTFLEWLLLHHASLNIFVSPTMEEHYRRKYRYSGSNTFIMPCYNQDIMQEAFYKEGKYTRPSFVYAGAMLAWQCVEEALLLYCKVKERYPNATLTLLTNGKVEATRLIEKHKAKDVTIKFVPVQELNNEQSKYKYGLLLRSNDTVNNVATPTKFNSYLAVGLIPVISRVIGAYNPIINNMKYVVATEDEKDLDSAYNQICEIESTEIKSEDVYKEYSQIFQSYYNTQGYIDKLEAKLRKYVV